MPLLDSGVGWHTPMSSKLHVHAAQSTYTKTPLVVTLPGGILYYLHCTRVVATNEPKRNINRNHWTYIDVEGGDNEDRKASTGGKGYRCFLSLLIMYTTHPTRAWYINGATMYLGCAASVLHIKARHTGRCVQIAEGRSKLELPLPLPFPAPV